MNKTRTVSAAMDSTVAAVVLTDIGSGLSQLPQFNNVLHKKYI